MRVRGTGQAVVCPHCSSHLRVPAGAVDGTRLQSESGSGVLDRVASRSGVLRKSDSGTNVTAQPQTGRPSGKTVSKNLFVIVASYASAVTLAFLWMFFTSRTHQLESLPDVRTLSDGELQFAGFDAQLPPKHTLALKESRRFGDVRVTPLRVTREPILFEHYADKSQLPPQPTAPVLKLWLQFENMSERVSFPPYDMQLMCLRGFDKSDQVKANTFLARQDTPRSFDNIALNFDHPRDSEWNLQQQQVGPLAPGSRAVTFVASCEEVDALTADTTDVLWRVQIRKGINEKSRRGVTTLIDVVFSTGDIEDAG